ncbi:helix-turn-helix domain-containing protein [Haloarcula laminariae]|uniref:helix-turn-helix domain-containing protein n=1 Tax=Haloarcula laminariae TaxID=2961577 RepID=UPI0021C653D6|nr:MULTISPECIES: helix-turn-helix domain-containing protein [Halomicroarcula]
MVSIADFTLPAADFPLGKIFEDRPEATLELDRVVPSGDTVMPYFWVQDPGRDLEGVRALFDGLPELRSADLLVDTGEKGLFRAEWEPEYLGIMEAIAAAGVTVLAASGSADGWNFEIRATTVEQLSQFQQRCSELDVDVTLARLSQLSEMAPDTGYDLTPEQHEALLLAYESGYYDDPRAVDQTALASELGITRQAFASRLRRGYRSLIGSTLLSGRDGNS